MTDGSSEAPVTARGRRTRAALIDAARHVFEERGYGEARITDITQAAGVSHGTFYTYFDSKLAIFSELMDRLLEDFRAEADATPLRGTSPVDRIERANRGYLRAYIRNARMMGVLEHAALVSPELQRMRIDSRRYWVRRAESTIRHWQDVGLVAADLDPHYSANALGSMVDRFAYVWLVLGEPFELERAVETLTGLYCRALGLDGQAEAAVATGPEATGTSVFAIAAAEAIETQAAT
jgi:AcrR family transcriptional regulator